MRRCTTWRQLPTIPSCCRVWSDFWEQIPVTSHKHKTSGNKLANVWKAYVETEVVSVSQLAARRKRVRWGLDLIQATFNFLKVILGSRIMNSYLRNLRITRRQLRQQEQTLDKFLPFMVHNSFIFETGNIRRAYNLLTPKDQERLQWTPERYRLGRLLGQYPHQGH